ncbi:MAG: murein biosynthesis integral membrane protein MurJ [Spirochaetales bacterium]|nr:murein biosynthesis integral membrane protein MurJ [Spirochaetales bacterium]MDY5914011.1 murein biosynthesis integral membrane protein MurJ [Treponema sp.]
MRKMTENENSETTIVKQKKSIVKSGLVLSLMTFASRIMGLLREMTKASFLGTSMHADAFSTAFMIPNLFRRLFAENAISVAFIPTFKSYLEKDDSPENRNSTQEFLKATFTLVSFLTACVVVIGIIITPLLMPLFCKKPTDTTAADYAMQLQAWLLKKDEITILTRIMFPYLFVISIAAFFQGILNGCKIFAPSGFTPVLFNAIVIIATYVLAPFTENPARAMSIGVILGGCVQAFFQWPFVRKTGWKICFTSLKKTFSNPGTKKVISLVVPTIIGMAAYQLNDVVSTSLANRGGDGIASSLQYSLRLQELILGIFAVSIGTVILPDLSGLASSKKWEDFNKMLIQAIKIMTLISIPVTVYSLITGKELISLLYKSKSFDDDSVALTLGEFRFHIMGLLFIALNRIISPAFYAQGNTKLPTLAGIISFGANIVLALVFVRPFGGNGIALALTLASFVNTLFLFIFMKKLDSFKIRKVVFQTLGYILKMAVYSIIAAIPCYFVHSLLVKFFAENSRIVSYGIPVILTALLFAVIGIAELIITKDEIIHTIIQKVKSKKR